MDASPRIWARLSEVQARRAASGGRLPRELAETAPRRLGVLALVTAATFLFFFFAHIPAGLRSEGRAMVPIAVGGNAGAIILSLIMFGLTRRRRVDPRRLLDLGLAYQLAMALVIGVVDNLAALPQLAHVRGWSGVAVWIFICGVFIPGTPRRTLWVSAVVAAFDPLTVLLDHALGSSLPPLGLAPQLFAPTLLAVVTAVVAARINCRLAQRLHEARELGSYRLLELLGKGGMGEVWRAEHRMLARPAAIKVIRTEVLVAGTRTFAQGVLQRFEREAQATALLQCEHTIQLFDFGVAEDGSFYYVMELLDGLDLEVVVTRFGPLPPARVIHCLLQVCDSLAEAHASGLIHRDIKPSNIFVCRRGLSYDVVKVLDFGLVTGVGSAPTENALEGTPAYMSPEVITGTAPVDGRADLYALGCVAYYLLSGRLVFDADEAFGFITHHLNAEPARLTTRSRQEIPPALEAVVHACLEKDPGRRPLSAADLRGRLEAVALDRPWTQESARAWWQQAAPAAAGAGREIASTVTVREGPRPAAAE